jgi:iron complex outermembrane receptor protein
MKKRPRTGRKTAKVFVLVVFALSLLTSPTWAQSGTVSGTVIDAYGDPMPGVLVSLQNQDGSSTGKVATSDANGAYSITGVAAGTYTVAANLVGFQPASQSVEVTSGGQLTVDFEMSELFHREIIVSAQRVEEDILDVPMTISAFDTQAMEELQIQNKLDVQELTPGLQFGDETVQDGQGTVIRGIGTRIAAANHADLAVATYVDGAYTLGTYGVAPGGGFDMKRVEVARGPQGTLHGRNSVAGSINLVTIKPEQRWDANFMSEATGASQWRLNGAIGGPIAGPFSFRLTAGTHQGDGYQENIGLASDLAAPDQTFWAPQLRIRTDRFDMNIRWSHVEDNGLSRQLVQLTNVDTTTPEYCLGEECWVNEYYLYATPNPAISPDCPPGVPGHLCGDVYNKVATNLEASNESTSDFGTMYANYQISENVNVRYSFSYSDVASINWTDGDRTNREGMPNDHTLAHDSGLPEFANFAYRMPFEYQETSHELTFTGVAGNFNYVGGFFQYENDRKWTIDRHDFNMPFRFMTADDAARQASPIWGYYPIESCADAMALVEELGFGTTDPARADEFEGLVWYCPEGADHTRTLAWWTDSRSETRAAFFSGNYRFSPNWALSGGIRYTEDTKVQGTEDSGGFAISDFMGLTGVTFSEGEGAGRELTWSKPIGHLALEYTSDAGHLIYGRISTGFRAGGFNITDVPGQVPPFIKEETLTNYEVGTKGAFFNSRLQIAAGLWYYDFRDYQITALMEPPDDVLIPPSIWSDTPLVEYTDNIPKTTVYGLDLEMTAYIGDHWTLRGFYAYQESEIGEHSSVLVGDPDAEYGEWEHTDWETGEWITSLYELPTDLTGNSLPMQPKHKLALTGGWNIPLGRAGGALQLFTTYSFTDRQYIDIGNLDYWELPSYDRWDLSIGWTPERRRWTVTLFAKNLADEIAIIEMVPAGLGGTALGYLSNPREIGLQLHWRPFN